MKRILLCLTLLLSICASCVAFNPPQPPRWEWLGSDEHLGVWLDKDTARFYTGSKVTYHTSDRCATVWILFYNADKNETEMGRFEFDMDCRLMRELSGVIYDSQGKVIDRTNYQYARFDDVIPGSLGEDMYEAVERLSKSKGI